MVLAGWPGPVPAADSVTLGADTLTCQNGKASDQPTAQYRLCRGYVHSFDGVPLDTDLTLPKKVDGPVPLLVMMHGWGNSKTDWEASSPCPSGSPDRCNYNNVYFATQRGYAVLNYSARGFHGSCGPDYPMPADPACARGWTHLSDRRYEIHDTQHLAGLLVDAGIARPGIGVTGGSYGGGQSLLLAIQNNKVTNTDGSLVSWTSPKGVAMSIAAAVAKYPWSDLADSLLPNGRASDGVLVADASRVDPIGVEKQSYVSALYADGQASARYAPPGVDPTADLVTWFGLISAGERAYSQAGPVIEQTTKYKSAYYQDDLIAAQARNQGGEVPIFDIQGWTDPLFPYPEGASFIAKLKAKDPSWPAWLYASDVGHPNAANKPDDWRQINAQASAFLAAHLRGSGPAGSPPAAVQEQVTTCGGSGGGQVRPAASLSGIATGRMTFNSSEAGHQTSSAGTDAAASSADPLGFYARNNQQGGCIKLPQTPPPGTAVTSWSWPVSGDFTLSGQPMLNLSLTVTGPDAEIDSRIWDVAPDGSLTLVTRGVFRWNPKGSAPAGVSYALFGNAWSFRAGHALRLEVTQNDAPYLRLDDYVSHIDYSMAGLTLPTA